MKNWRVQLTAREKMFSGGENQETYIPGRRFIAIIICNSYDTTQSLTKEKYRRINTISQEKINHLMYMYKITLFARNENH